MKRTRILLWAGQGLNGLLCGVVFASRHWHIAAVFSFLFAALAFAIMGLHVYAPREKR